MVILSKHLQNLEDTTEIVAIDLFEDYEYKSGSYQFIKEMFKEHDNVKILKDSFINTTKIQIDLI